MVIKMLTEVMRALHEQSENFNTTSWILVDTYSGIPIYGQA